MCYLTVLAPLNFDFSDFCILSELKFTKNTNSEHLKVSKLQFLRHQLLIKLISRKI